MLMGRRMALAGGAAAIAAVPSVWARGSGEDDAVVSFESFDPGFGDIVAIGCLDEIVRAVELLMLKSLDKSAPFTGLEIARFERPFPVVTDQQLA